VIVTVGVTVRTTGGDPTWTSAGVTVTVTTIDDLIVTTWFVGATVTTTASRP
jgi:hypothetical protein